MYPDIVMVFVLNKQSQLYMAQRSDEKDRFPGFYAIGSGGKIDEGETPGQAASRENKEELGFIPDLEHMFNFTFEDEKDSYKCNIFKTQYEGPFTVCQREYQWSGWMTLSEVDKLYNQGKLAPDTAEAYKIFKEKNSKN